MSTTNTESSRPTGFPSDAAALGARLERRLARAFPLLDAARIADGVEDVLLEWWASGRATPLNYSAAFRQARCNCIDIVRSETARAHREATWHAAVYEQGIEWHAHQAAASERLSGALQALMPDDRMRSVFRLWLDGQSAASTFADALGVGDVTPEVQRLVKAEKDRLRQFLRRNRGVRECAARHLTWRGNLNTAAPCESATRPLSEPPTMER